MIKSDENIVKEIFDILMKENTSLNLKETSDIISLIPKLVIVLERDYKRLRGIERKKIVLLVLKDIIQRNDNLNEMEVQTLVVMIPIIIDGLVYIGNKTSDTKLFKKLKKKCNFCTS